MIQYQNDRKKKYFDFSNDEPKFVFLFYYCNDIRPVASPSFQGQNLRGGLHSFQHSP